ncbi:MAG: CCA tRNA nucleotidyltransferase, partial [Paracoccus sp. (in: a-proteobacteria)]|nr:CCA tRNA nucleotidyltransferase [Paracoccus sp. (in: a-proteobacteria)]
MSRALPRIEAPFLRDPALQAVLGAIGAGGHRALIVGGAVRNALLGAPVADVDIATDARPDQVIALARAAGLRSVPTGIAHGTVTVISDGRGFEVTTFRRDVETDGRRAVVAFSDDLAQDAARRDFTMNALYAEPGGQVIDPVGGLDDLRARRLAFVGAPEARIREDYLRILRFFRFLAWYGRDAEPQALAACTELRAGLTQISAERITAELMRLLAAPDPSEALDLMAQSGVLAQVLPGADNRAIAALVEAEQEHEAPPNEARRAERRLAALGQGLHEALRLPKAAQTRLAKLGKAQEAP